QVLRTAGNGEIAIRVYIAEVAGYEPSVGTEVPRGLFGRPPIAFEDIGSLAFDGTDLALRQVLSCLRFRHAARTARQRKAYRSRPPFAAIGIRRDHVGLGHAVTLKDGVVRTRGEGTVRFR